MQKPSGQPSEYVLLLASWVLMVVFMTTYWVQVQSAAQQQTRLAEDLAKSGIEQTSHALALQTETMLRKLDYVAAHLVEQWQANAGQDFKAAASKAQPAKVINITSVDGQRVNPWETYSYQASKAALIHLTRRMAARLVKDHIYVTSLAPGAFPSNMNKAARDHADRSAAGIPTVVMVAPVIPAVNDSEIEAILSAARTAGAAEAGYVMLRLPHEENQQ